MIARRRRGVYVGLLLATVMTGFAVHMHGHFLGGLVRDVLGDALWAAMIVWLLALVLPSATTRTIAIGAIVVCVLVELSQLLRAEWLDDVRGTMIGHLVLGSDYDTRDLFAYGAGVVAAALLDVALRRRSARGDAPPIPSA